MHSGQGAGIKRVAASTEVPSIADRLAAAFATERCWADGPMHGEINRGPDQRNPTTREERPALPDV